VRPICLLLGLALLVAACRGADEASVRPDPAAAPPSTALVIRGGRLAEIDARTLEPLPGRAVHLRGHNGGIALSPDGSRAAAGGAKSIRIVDLTRFEVVADLPKPHGYSRLVSWGDPDRIVVVSEVFRRNRVDVLVLAVDSGRLLSRRSYPAEDGWPHVVRAANGSVAFLLHPMGGIGPTRLVHVDRSGCSRLYRLDRIASGSEWVDSTSVIRDLWPALALDADGTHAYVFGVDDFVAEVDLTHGEVSNHSLEPRLSLAGRLWNWLEPSAEAKASDWTQLGALWLGDGMLALFGDRTVPIVEGDTHHEVGKALGFRLVDTADWSVRMVDDEVISMERSRDMLLAWGHLWSSVTRQYSGIGLRAYDLEGERLFHVLGNQRVETASIVGATALAKLADQQGTVAVDVAGGRVLQEPVSSALVPSRVVGSDAP
jgi:hypothetical protein